MKTYIWTNGSFETEFLVVMAYSLEEAIKKAETIITNYCADPEQILDYAFTVNTEIPIILEMGEGRIISDEIE